MFCIFLQLITDVAKDLDLTLQDLSPDIEIFTDSLSSSASPSKPQIISALRKHTPFSRNHVGSSAQSIVGRDTSPPCSPPSSPHAGDHSSPDDLHISPHSESDHVNEGNIINSTSKANTNSHQPSSLTNISTRQQPEQYASAVRTGDNYHYDNDDTDAQNRRLRSGIEGVVSSTKSTHQEKANGHTQSEHKISRNRRFEQQSQNGHCGVPLRRRPGSERAQRNGTTVDFFKNDTQCLECK